MARHPRGIAPKHPFTFVSRLAYQFIASAALADPWKDESGHGKGRKHDRREFKEEYWDGNCKVERKLGKNGEYKEARKCKGPHHGHYRQAPVYVPAPPAIIVEPGITVHGTVRIP